MMNKNLIALSLLFCIILGGFLFAQEPTPDDPDVIIPQVILQVQDLEQEEIDVILPDIDTLPVPEINLPLPLADELVLPEEAFEIPLPREGMIMPDGEQDFFSEGSVGMGNRSSLIGDITLYKLGDFPRFVLGFYHEKLDGYNGRSSGSGYYRRNDRLNAELGGSLGKGEVMMQGVFDETENGLQDTVSFGALSENQLTLSAAGAYRLSPVLKLDSSLAYEREKRIITGSNPVQDSESALETQLGMQWYPADWELMTQIHYRYERTDTGSGQHSQAHRFGMDMEAAYLVHDWLYIKAGAGVRYLLNGRPYFPFSLSLEMDRPYGSLNVSGGRYWEVLTNAKLHDELPFVVYVNQDADSGWQADVAGGIRLPGGLSFKASCGLRYAENALIITGPKPAGAQLLSPVRGADWQLQPGVQVKWQGDSGFSALLAWEAGFLSRSLLEQGQTVALDVGYKAEEGHWGVGLQNRFNFALPSLVPVVNLNGYYAVSETVRFRFDGHDLLAPLIPQGRLNAFGYEEAGLYLTFKTKISM